MCKASSPQKNDGALKQAATSVKAEENDSPRDKSSVYSWTEPEGSDGLRMKDHFSSLLFGGSILNTLLEFTLLIAPIVASAIYGDALNVDGSMPFTEVWTLLLVCAFVRRVYNAYLEAVYFSFPKLRTQPVKEHKLKQKKDLMGRDIKQLELLHWHDKGTMISQFIFNFGLYYALPGYYPAAAASLDTTQTFQERFTRLLLNHYVMSFGMYWAHRSLHVIPYLWDKIHSFHHYAKHPLSRNTYEDHWFDNFFNAIIGHCFAQILIPLDGPTFWFSRIFRIFESLEKHSGVSCGFNLAHSAQQWLPFAQMPHHHDWHHEGFKGSNYTFSSIGGLWDCLFGTRKAGRCKANDYYAATREDKNMSGKVQELPSWFSPTYPLVFLTALVVHQLTN